MWDSNSPMQLLKSMPAKLSYENLQKIQLVIDVDKYKNSIVSGFDLCGIYAPFCRGCNKMNIYPCAVAYVKMMQMEGMQVEIDAAPAVKSEPEPVQKEEIKETAITEEPKIYKEPEKEPVEEVIEESAATEYIEPAVEEPVKAEEPVKQENKIRIRIAVAKKKV